MTDEEWALIADLVAPYWSPGQMGRPVTVERRRVVDAIFYVAATGFQWRALPESYPNWNTVHRYHLAWSRDGTWKRSLPGSLQQSAEPRAAILNRPPGSSTPAACGARRRSRPRPGVTTRARRSRAAR